MKKTLSIILALTLCVALFAACTTTETQTEAPADTSAETEKTGTDSKVISPLPETIDIENLDNCMVSVGLNKGDAYVDDSGKMVMNVEVYSYELYDMVDIAGIEVGDIIIRQGEEIEISELETLDSGLVSINGGTENGGFDLTTDESSVYYEIGMSDAKAYYSLGKVIVPVSTEFRYSDESDINGEVKEYFPGDFLIEDAGIEYDFSPYNTKIVIENGEIIAMTKTYLS